MKKAIVALMIAAVAMLSIAGNLVADPMTGADFIAEARSNILHVNVEVAKDLFETGEYVFIDVREESETRMGVLPGAMLIPRGVVEFRIPGMIEDKNAKIVVYCKSGGRSALATNTLKLMGYTNVISMDGGFTAWSEAGLPIEG